jgi:hypothetical protein
MQCIRKFPVVKECWEMLEERSSFKKTKPIMFELTEKVA